MDHAAGRKKEQKSFTEGGEGVWFSHKIGIQTPVPFVTFMGNKGKYFSNL
jgi:hypothetical protein